MNFSKIIKNILVYSCFIYLMYTYFPSFNSSHGILIDSIFFICNLLLNLIMSTILTLILHDVIDEIYKFLGQEYPKQVESYYNMRLRLREYFSDSSIWRSIFTFLSFIFFFRKRLLYLVLKNIWKYKFAYLIFFILFGFMITLALIFVM